MIEWAIVITLWISSNTNSCRENVTDLSTFNMHRHYHFQMETRAVSMQRVTHSVVHQLSLFSPSQGTHGCWPNLMQVLPFSRQARLTVIGRDAFKETPALLFTFAFKNNSCPYRTSR